MDSEVIAAIIALSGAILSIGISLIISLWTRRYNYNQLFAETVSESRNKWLNEMRAFISTMLAEVQSSNNGRTNEYWKASNKITINFYNIKQLLILIAKQMLC